MTRGQDCQSIGKLLSIIGHLALIVNLNDNTYIFQKFPINAIISFFADFGYKLVWIYLIWSWEYKYSYSKQTKPSSPYVLCILCISLYISNYQMSCKKQYFSMPLLTLRWWSSSFVIQLQTKRVSFMNLNGFKHMQRGGPSNQAGLWTNLMVGYISIGGHNTGKR